MTQENGMPMRFQAWDKKDKEMLDWKYLFNLMLVETRENIFTNEDLIVLQAIGATSSDDPPQELYLGDLIEFEFEEGQRIGEIFWYNADKQVYLKLNQPHQGRKFIPFWLVAGVKKLGSRYTKKGKEILKRAGLWGERRKRKWNP